MYERFVRFVRQLYDCDDFIPLHQPNFPGNEKKFVADAIDSTYVSSVGSYVDEFEMRIMAFTGARHAVATVNGTSALHIALLLAGVEPGNEVITQSLTFVATSNAIRYCGAEPVFVDVDRDTLGMSSQSLADFLDQVAELHDDGICRNKITGRPLAACVPMHTFGFPADLDAISEVCHRYNITLVEDAAESLGSWYKKKHTGTEGKLAILSFNGNKIMTTGGGGMILTNDKILSQLAKHLTTTAKMPHRWAFMHDQIGYNFRLPNLNAALGVAQLESLPDFLESKRKVAASYLAWGIENGLEFVSAAANTKPNYWLNAALTENKHQRDKMLKYTNDNGVMTRPAWKPMHRLPMNQKCLTTDLSNTEWLYDRLVNVPSSVISND